MNMAKRMGAAMFGAQVGNGLRHWPTTSRRK